MIFHPKCGALVILDAESISGHLAQLAALFFVSSLFCAGFIKWALPLAAQMAVAKPNTRSSHLAPTPQIGGLFVFLTISLLLGALFIFEADSVTTLTRFALAAALALTLIGFVDDRTGLSPVFRLVTYGLIAFGLCLLLPTETLAFGMPSPIMDRIIAGAFLLAFMNITNFMDGIDGMMVVEFVPMLIFASLSVALGVFSSGFGALPIILAGALMGFFVFNRPQARIFLGDAGSVPVGFLVGVILLDLATLNSVIVALVLPMYFFADAGFTLLKRLMRGEKIWLPHRQHFYQQAFDAAQGNWSILARVFTLNLALCAVSLMGGIFALSVAVGLTALLLLSLSRRPRA